MKTTKTMPYILTGSSLSVICGGKPTTISSSDAAFGSAVSAIRENRWADVLKAINPAHGIKNYYSGFIKVVDGQVFYRNRPLDNEVTEKILYFMNNNLPFTSLTRFLSRLMKNPNPLCRKALYSFMEKEQMPIDDLGFLIGYKSIRKDNLCDWYSNTIQHKIGQTVYWGQRKKERNVRRNLDYGADCGKFYHIGHWEYASSFHAGENTICLCRVDPQFIKSVPEEASMGKIRCCKYTPFAFYDTEGKALAPNYFKHKRVEQSI